MNPLDFYIFINTAVLFMLHPETFKLFWEFEND
jgi:hypothetical protein